MSDTHDTHTPPPELLCRTAVRRFALAMETNLTRHDHDLGERGWESVALEPIYLRLLEKVGELSAALRRKDCITAQYKAADVGNFAMMIRERCGDLHRQGG